MDISVFFILYGVTSFAIGYFLGKKRQIGFGWSFFFCIFLSPVGGFIITMLSRKYYNQNPEPSKSKRHWGMLLIFIFCYRILFEFMDYSGRSSGASPLDFLLSIGFIGLGFYLKELGKGKNFNHRSLRKTDYD